MGASFSLWLWLTFPAWWGIRSVFSCVTDLSSFEKCLCRLSVHFVISIFWHSSCSWTTLNQDIFLWEHTQYLQLAQTLPWGQELLGFHRTLLLFNSSAKGKGIFGLRASVSSSTKLKPLTASTQHHGRPSAKQYKKNTLCSAWPTVWSEKYLDFFFCVSLASIHWMPHRWLICEEDGPLIFYWNPSQY